jgi:hypothetical protein
LDPWTQIDVTTATSSSISSSSSTSSSITSHWVYSEFTSSSDFIQRPLSCTHPFFNVSSFLLDWRRSFVQNQKDHQDGKGI